MVNSQLQHEISNAFKIDERVERIPSAIPVVEVGIKSVSDGYARSERSTATGTTTMSAALLDNTNGIVYLSRLNISLIKNALCDTATSNLAITIVQNGNNVIIGAIPIITLTAQSIEQVYDFSRHPLKLDLNTTITLAGAFGAGAMNRCMSAHLFKDEIN